MERIHSDWLLEGIILPVFNENFPDFDVKRSDKITTPGMIDAQMINHLLDDEVVIADLTSLNPNVFYEIGLRHMAQKPIIHMFTHETKIPFDIQPFRSIAYSVRKTGDISRAKQDLLAALSDVVDETYEVENPVTRARGALQLNQRATPEMKMLWGEVEVLRDELKQILVPAAIDAENKTSKNARFDIYLPFGQDRSSNKMAEIDKNLTNAHKIINSFILNLPNAANFKTNRQAINIITIDLQFVRDLDIRKFEFDLDKLLSNLHPRPIVDRRLT